MRLLSILLAVLLSLESGCETSAPRSADSVETETVAIVPFLQPPDIQFTGFPRSKVQGAAAGFGAMFAECASKSSGCSGSSCGAELIVMLGACAVMGGIGAGMGAGLSPSARQVREGEERFVATLGRGTIQRSLRDAVAASAGPAGPRIAVVPEDVASAAVAAQDYRGLAADGIEEVLVVGITKVGTTGAGIDSPLALHMDVQAELLRTSDNASLHVARYRYVGESLTLEDWSRDDGQPLMQGLERAYRSVGQHIYDGAFRLYPFPDPKPQGDGTFGLAPLKPATHSFLARGAAFWPSQQWVPVDSLTPTLEWQAFPRPDDLAAAGAELGRVTDVLYDLIVAREQYFGAQEIVYRRDGLPEAKHTLEAALTPRTRYFWTVRARFRLDGRERVTPWGEVSASASPGRVPPCSSSYRFRTP